MIFKNILGEKMAKMYVTKTLVCKKIAIFSTENRSKSLKIVIIILTPAEEKS
jgi:hypothetical protein